MQISHKDAVLAFQKLLEERGGMVISANVEPQAIPQVYAQNEENAFSFYLLQAPEEAEPTKETIQRFLTMAAKHEVIPYQVKMNPDGSFDVQQLFYQLTPNGKSCPQAQE